MDELTSLEKKVYKYIQQSKELSERNKELEAKIAKLEKENELLKLKLEENDYSGNQLSKNIKKSDPNLKSRIDDLIDRIDYHLSS
jgi:phage shock protein A